MDLRKSSNSTLAKIKYNSTYCILILFHQCRFNSSKPHLILSKKNQRTWIYYAEFLKLKKFLIQEPKTTKFEQSHIQISKTKNKKGGKKKENEYTLHALKSSIACKVVVCIFFKNTLNNIWIFA